MKKEKIPNSVFFGNHESDATLHIALHDLLKELGFFKKSKKSETHVAEMKMPRQKRK
jgi:hypothetical protein